MAESNATETEEDRKKREAREEQQQRATQLSLSDATGFLGKVGDLFGTVFNWGIPALLIGGLLLAGAKPIAELIKLVSPEWAEKFLGFTEIAKDWINEKTGKKIFDVDASLVENFKRGAVIDNPELIRAPIAKQLGADLATAIIPDKMTAAELVTNFLPSHKLSLGQLQANPELFMQPELLTDFVRRYPQTMQRVVAALPQPAAGAVGQVPDALKAPLKQLLGNPQSLTALLDNPHHAQWINGAVVKLGGENAAKAFTAMRTNPSQLAGLIGDMIDGVPMPQALERAKQHGPLPAVVNDLAYETAKSDSTYGAMIAAIETKDPSFAAELKAVLERTTDAKQVGEHVLAMVTSKPERIAALKDLTPEQLTPILGALSLKFDAAETIMFADKSVRDAAIDALAAVARTNSAGKNELGDLFASMNKPEGDVVTRAAEVARYIQGNPARAQALQTFAAAIEQSGSNRGTLAAQGDQPAIDAKQLYTERAQALQTLVSAPEKAIELAKVHAALPAHLQPITASMLTQGPSYLADLMVNDDARAMLNEDANGRKNLYLIGDALRQADLTKLGAQGGMLGALLTQGAGGSYPNLDTMVASIDLLDNKTGLNAQQSIPLMREAQELEQGTKTATPEQLATLQGQLQPEVIADRTNMNMMAFIQGIQGAKLQGGDGVDAKYSVETAFGTITYTPNEIASYFNANESLLQHVANLSKTDIAGLDEATKQKVASVGARLWNDKNGNGVIEAGEGAAAVLKSPTEVAMMMVGVTTPQTAPANPLWHAVGEMFADTFVVSDDLKDMRAIAATLRGTGSTTNGQNVAAVEAPSDNNRLAHHSGLTGMGMGSAKFL